MVMIMSIYIVCQVEKCASVISFVSFLFSYASHHPPFKWMFILFLFFCIFTARQRLSDFDCEWIIIHVKPKSNLMFVKFHTKSPSKFIKINVIAWKWYISNRIELFSPLFIHSSELQWIRTTTQALLSNIDCDWNVCLRCYHLTFRKIFQLFLFGAFHRCSYRSPMKVQRYWIEKARAFHYKLHFNSRWSEFSGGKKLQDIYTLGSQIFGP